MSSQRSSDRLDKQPSEPKALDFNYAALDAQTRLFVQQRRSEIKTLMRRAASDIFDLRQKLIQVTAVEIRKIYVFGCSAASTLNSRLPVSLATVAKVGGAVEIRKIYVFGCSAASALNSRLPVSLATVAKVHLELGVWQLFSLEPFSNPFTRPHYGQLVFISHSPTLWTTSIYLSLVHIMDN